MDTAKLNDWLQVIGLFGVIGSLLFVGLQMKQDREIALSVAFQARAESTAETLLSMSQNEAYVSVYAALNSGDFETITGKDRTAFSIAIVGGMYLWENSYYQFRDGFLPEDHWNRTRTQMKNILNNSITRGIAKSHMPNLLPDFREELEKVISEIEVATDP